MGAEKIRDLLREDRDNGYGYVALVINRDDHAKLAIG
jgi:hypothetical protein